MLENLLENWDWGSYWVGFGVAFFFNMMGLLLARWMA